MNKLKFTKRFPEFVLLSVSVLLIGCVTSLSATTPSITIPYESPVSPPSLPIPSSQPNTLDPMASRQPTVQERAANTPIQSTKASGSTNIPLMTTQFNSDMFELHLPPQQQVPPPDVLDQIVYGERGGQVGMPIKPAPPCGGCDVDYVKTDDIWQIDTSKIQLTGFKPNQSLFILFYSPSDTKDTCGMGISEYVIGKFVTVNPKGEMVIKVMEEQYLFVQYIYDGNTGWLQWAALQNYVPGDCSGYSDTIGVIRTYECTNSFQTRLYPGHRAQITYTDGTPSRLRSEPVIDDSTFLKYAPEGTKMFIIEGPACNAGYVWWYVYLDNGSFGWLAEGAEDKWFLEPLPIILP